MAHTILIADDSASESLLMEEALTGAGYRCLLARDGREAERLFATERPDLVVLDVVMPGRDGYQVCRTIRNDPERGRTPVVMVSFRGEASDRYWGIRQGASVYLGKPFEAGQLLSVVKELLG